MSIDYVQYNAHVDVHNILLSVELATSTQIVVRAGSIKLSSTDYTLTQDETWDLPVVPVGGMEVVGNLAWDTVLGELHVLVDELTSGVVGYPFGGAGSFQLLHPLFRFYLVEGATTLTGVSIEVVHFTVVPWVGP